MKPIKLFKATLTTLDDIDVSSLMVEETEIVDVYKNGKWIESPTVDVGTVVDLTETYAEQDIIEIVRREPTTALLDAGTYAYDYPYSTTTVLNDSGTESTVTYYFWVGHKKVRQSGAALSLNEAELRLADPTIPFMIPQKFESESATQPARYSQLIVRGLSKIVNDDNRYIFRFTRDFTLRDNIDDSDSELELKNKHTEWAMIREAQPYHIPRALWDKITESLIQETLDGSTRVPTLDRELYDETHKTDTRFGLRTGQAFVDKSLALNTIQQDLQNPGNNFYPIDISTFFASHNFDTVEDIKDSMETIYQTFSFDHVNRIFFSVLYDAMTTKNKYPDLFKTSMVALHGIRILEVGGVYDD